ncbi:lysylphosphatidylglycerol synthase transmembrane domain-containing protein [Dactylosporangium matsuzakiense]|uniref:lysylphosphatidylglycerol synthase transmembrane domain-containing protein n=1 Tax=Dactylosporangium matsuzakiense TaxID=53360 RepID=UPI0021C33465|nr:lysylphosphatidylglycerol synthase transmembrane domain-containing protein [Dactylosporangium matsuzakiense]UWZ42060.1 flippase-like domain-containing protein [Dactylosporangium matsuzakiense]
MGKRRRTALRVFGLLLVLAVAVLTLRTNLPDLGQTLDVLRSAHPWWLLLAAAAEMTSLRHFALQQRRLLAGFGVRMSVPRAIAVTFTRSAISFSLPAGSAVSAGFAFRQFRTAGATRRSAGAVAVLSGVLSGVALLLMYGAVVLIPRGGATGNTDTLVLVLAMLVIAGLVFLLDFLLSPRRPAPPPVLADDDPEHPTGRIARVRASVSRTWDDLRRLPRRSWVLSLVHATVNWGLDFACLAATAAAFGIDVSLVRLATVYLTVQLVRQIPLSPGGIGVVEVALLAGLVSAGAAHGPAAAAMLVYRLLSCWIIIPLGLLTYATLRRGPKVPDAPPVQPPALATRR